MDTRNFADWLQILGNLGIVIGLFFVGFQLVVLSAVGDFSDRIDVQPGPFYFDIELFNVSSPASGRIGESDFIERAVHVEYMFCNGIFIAFIIPAAAGIGQNPERMFTGILVA